MKRKAKTNEKSKVFSKSNESFDKKDSKSFEDKKDFKSKKTFKSSKPYIGPNDIRWRTGDAVMTELVGNLPFGYAAGLARPLNLDATGIETAIRARFIQPGVISISTYVTAGSTDASVTDPYNAAINLAFRKIYSWVRHANAGSKVYEASDLGLYFIACGQALALLGWLQRAYRTLCEYSATNRYTPTLLLNAMGCNHEDLIDHLPQLKYLIAWMGRAIKSLCFPNLPYFEACYEAFKHVIVDSDSPKEQYYLLNLRAPGLYNPTYSSTGGGIDYSSAASIWKDGSSSPYMTFDDISKVVHQVMDVLLSDEDVGIMSGDILKAENKGGGTGLFSPTAFGDSYELFVKSEEMLQQIHNAHIIPEGSEVDKLKGYTQMPGATNQAPYIIADFVAGSGINASHKAAACHYFIIDAFSREPDAKEVVNCSVLNPVARLAQNTPATNYRVTSIVFDLYYPVAAYLRTGVGTNSVVSNISNTLRRFGTSLQNAGLDLSGSRLTNFDWHPFVVQVDTDTEGEPWEVLVFGDIQNIGIFDYDVAVRVHENSMLSLFAFQEHNFY